MSYFNVNPQLLSPPWCCRVTGTGYFTTTGQENREQREKKKDWNHESISIAPGLWKALRMVINRKKKGPSSMKTKQGRRYVYMHATYIRENGPSLYKSCFSLRFAESLRVKRNRPCRSSWECHYWSRTGRERRLILESQTSSGRGKLPAASTLKPRRH